MIGALGMYDFPWLAAANDAIWTALGGTRLDRSRPLAAIWADPDLTLAQTCGWPLMTAHPGLQVVVTPTYDLPGCDGAWHCSLIVVADDSPAASLADVRGSRAAINGRDSNTGMNLLRAAVAPVAGGRAFFGSVGVTGAHLNSIAAVAARAADVAAIDCVTHGLIARHRPDLLAGTRVLARTPMSPGLPLVTAAGTAPATLAALRDALRGLFEDSRTARPRAALGWTGMAAVPKAAYARVLDLADEARALGMDALK